MKKRRVLFVTQSLQAAGVDNSLVTALNAADSARFDVYVYPYTGQAGLADRVKAGINILLPSGRPHKYRDPLSLLLYLAVRALGFLGLKKAESKLNDRLTLLKRRTEADHYARDIKSRGMDFDTVIAYDFGLSPEIASRLPAGKRLFFYHGSKDIYAGRKPHPFERFDCIIGVSEGVTGMLSSAYPGFKDRFVTLSNYVDMGEIKEKSGMYRPDLPPDATVLATSGRISREKGFDLAVGAAAILKEKGFDFIWCFVGGGREEAEIKELIKKKDLGDRVRVTGFLDNPYPYIARCDLYVHTALEESCSLSIMEAQRLGKAVVSTATVGAKTLLSSDKSGILTGFSSEEIARGIIDLLTDAEKKKSSEGLFSEQDDIYLREQYIKGLNALLGDDRSDG